MEGWIEGSLTHVQNILRKEPDPLGDGPSVEGFQVEGLQNKKVECTVEKIFLSAHHRVSRPEGLSTFMVL
jgi:hypothetical protein